jgi:hypothetical protein
MTATTIMWTGLFITVLPARPPGLLRDLPLVLRRITRLRLMHMGGRIMLIPILPPDSILRSATVRGMVMEGDTANIMVAVVAIHSASAGLA